MKIKNEQLIDELMAIVLKCTTSAEKLKIMESGQLYVRPAKDAWNILECFEHLNRYGDFYLPAIEKAILSQEINKGRGLFKSGLIGNYFARLIQVKPGEIKKMSTTKDKDPFNQTLSVITIDRFLKQQQLLIALLNQARSIDLTNTKTPISISKFIRLRLGDTLRFMVYHIERHVLQAERIPKSIATDN